jgi:hypothetical protein
MSGEDPGITYRPVTRGRLKDLERFSEGHGKFRYCSCMRWRLSSTEFQRSTKDERVERLDQLVRGGEPVGVLAYADGEPIGWCSIAPRTQYEALVRSRALQPVDETPVWSVVCFFVDRRFRRRGGHARSPQGGRGPRGLARRPCRGGLSRGNGRPPVHVYGLVLDVQTGRLPRRHAQRTQAPRHALGREEPLRSLNPIGAGEGNRTPVSSLGSSRSAIEPHPREPTPWSAGPTV